MNTTLYSGASDKGLSEIGRDYLSTKGHLFQPHDNTLVTSDIGMTSQ